MILPRPVPIRAVLAAPRSAVRNQLRAWLRSEADLRLVGEAADGPAAVRLIGRTAPDLAVVHIQLPPLDGFEVVEALAGNGHSPAVVLVAPGPDGAVRAFRSQAIDYLQIPFDAARLRRSLDRVRRHLLNQAPTKQIPTPALDRTDDRMVLRSSGRLLLVRVEELLWVKAVRRRCELHLRDGIIHANVALGALAQRLPRDIFVQLNRSVMVRRDFIREIRGKSHGDRWVTFESGEECVLTRGRRQDVLNRL